MKSKLLFSVCLLGLTHEANTMFGRGKQQPAAPSQAAAPKPAAPSQVPAPSQAAPAQQPAQKPQPAPTQAPQAEPQPNRAQQADPRLAQMELELNKLRQDYGRIQNELAQEKQAHEATRSAAKPVAQSDIAAAVAGMSNEAIAGAALDLIEKSGVQADKQAGKAILSKLGQGQQSKTLGRLGKPSKK